MTEATVTYDFDRSKLALTYDVDRLRQEALAAAAHFPPYIHYSIIPLTTVGTRNEGVEDYSDPDWAEWVETPIMKDCPYIREVLDSLECRKTNIRLMRLEPNGVIQEHRDPQLNLDFRNQVRLHVPILINDAVEFMLNGTPVPLKAGELWYMRLSDPHSVHNRGSEERIQLSIDVVFNDWVENLILEGEKS